MPKIEFADKLSVLLDLDLLLNDETLRRFVQLKSLQVKCMNVCMYLLKGKDIVAVLPTGFANLCCFSVYQISCMSRRTIMFCNIIFCKILRFVTFKVILE